MDSEKVVLLPVSDSEELRHLVDALKKAFEEKYHTCAAFRDELLSGPEDSQRVAQTLQDERTQVILILNQQLHEILDHKKSRRLLNKIRDHFKAGRVVFVLHQIKVEEIQDFVADITDDTSCDIHTLSYENISHITTQIWNLPTVKRKATESDEISGAMLSPMGPSLDEAARKLHSSHWNTVDKESIQGDDFTRKTSDSSSDPQESHNSFSESMKSFDSGDSGSSMSSSSGVDGTIKSRENVQRLAGKLSAKLQVDLSKEDQENATRLGKPDILSKNKPTSLPQQAATADCYQPSRNTQCSAAKDDSKSGGKSLPCPIHQRFKEPHFGTAHSGDGWNVECQQSPGYFTGDNVLPVRTVRTSPQQEDSRLKVEERKCLQETTPNQRESSRFPISSPNLSNVHCCSQSKSNSSMSVPTQESCNAAEMVSSNGRSVDSEQYERFNELGSQLSVATSYQQVYCSTPIRCQKCNHIKDHVKLYSIIPQQTGLVSPTSFPNCFSFPNSSGPEAMTFSYSLCSDCSNNMFSTDYPVRENSFCGTNDTIQSSNLFPHAFERMSPFVVEQPVPPLHLSNFEKGVNPHQQRDAMPRHQSTPSRLYHQNVYPTNNIGEQEFRDEILRIDHNMRFLPPFQRNIPVNSAGSQQSNTDNTRIRSTRTCPIALSEYQATQSKAFQSHPSDPRLHEREPQNLGSWPSLQTSSYGGASSEMPSKPSNRLSGDDSAAGASAVYNGYDHLPLMDLSHVVIEYVQSQLDYTGSSTLNWEQLAHLHRWNFAMINTIKQKWQKRVIESPFLELLQNSKDFQNYTYGQLKLDLEKIPRKDILEKLREFEEKEKLVA